MEYLCSPEPIVNSTLRYPLSQAICSNLRNVGEFVLSVAISFAT